MFLTFQLAKSHIAISNERRGTWNPSDLFDDLMKLKLAKSVAGLQRKMYLNWIIPHRVCTCDVPDRRAAKQGKCQHYPF